MRSAVAVLEGLGAEVSRVSIPHSRESTRVLTVVSEAESAVDYRRVFPKERLDNIDPDLVEYIRRGDSYTMAEYLDGQRMAAVLRQEVDSVLEDVDIVVAPTCLTPAVLISQERKFISVRGQDVDYLKLLLRVTSISSVTGLPALSIPCGFSGDSLPIGLQLMGRRMEEARLLQIGHAYEQATDWHLQHPNID